MPLVQSICSSPPLLPPRILRPSSTSLPPPPLPPKPPTSTKNETSTGDNFLSNWKHYTISPTGQHTRPSSAGESVVVAISKAAATRSRSARRAGKHNKSSVQSGPEQCVVIQPKPCSCVSRETSGLNIDCPNPAHIKCKPCVVHPEQSLFKCETCQQYQSPDIRLPLVTTSKHHQRRTKSSSRRSPHSNKGHDQSKLSRVPTSDSETLVAKGCAEMESPWQPVLLSEDSGVLLSSSEEGRVDNNRRVITTTLCSAVTMCPATLAAKTGGLRARISHKISKFFLRSTPTSQQQQSTTRASPVAKETDSPSVSLRQSRSSDHLSPHRVKTIKNQESAENANTSAPSVNNRYRSKSHTSSMPRDTVRRPNSSKTRSPSPKVPCKGGGRVHRSSRRHQYEESSPQSLEAVPSVSSVQSSEGRRRELCGSKRGGKKVADDRHITFMENLDTLQKMGWYWGPLSFDEAGQVLANRPDGTFLVRDSADVAYILSLSFRARGYTYHTRIEHSAGRFSFWSHPVSHSASTLVEFIEKAVEHSQNGRYHYFLQTSVPGQPPIPVALLHPLSRFLLVPSLSHLARFAILSHLRRRDHIQRLPLPAPLHGMLSQRQYYVEDLDYFVEKTQALEPLAFVPTADQTTSVGHLAPSRESTLILDRPPTRILEEPLIPEVVAHQPPSGLLLATFSSDLDDVTRVVTNQPHNWPVPGVISTTTLSYSTIQNAHVDTAWV